MSDTIQASAAVLDRIRKLLAFANDGRGNENEMASAAAMAQKFLAEYNLSAAEISGAAETAKDAKREKTETGLTANTKWQADLMQTVAANNFCLHWVDSVHVKKRANGPFRNRKRHMLIGREHNVAMAVNLYEYLVGAMERLLPYEGMERKTLNAISWFTGCVDRINERLTQRREEDNLASKARAETGRGDGRSLVILDTLYTDEDSLNQDARNGWPPGTTAANRAARAARLVQYSIDYAANRPAREAEAIRFRAEQEAKTKIEYDALMAKLAKETPEQCARREAREARQADKAKVESERYWHRQRNRSTGDKHRGNHAYAAGSAVGQTIGLDRQVTTGGNTTRIKN